VNGISGVVPADPLARELRQFAERHDLLARGRVLDREPRFPWTEYRALGAARWLGLTLPAEWGGRALPVPQAAVVLHELACAAGTAFAKLCLQPEFSSVLAHHASAELRDRFFRPLMRGEVLIGNQVTEPESGSDVGAIRTRAERKGDSYEITGTKSQAAFAADASLAIVYARTSEGPRTQGISAFLVPQDLPGVRRTVGDDLGERWMRRGQVTYDRVPVPASHRIGEEGRAFGYLGRELTHERVLLAGIYLGVARASWEETVAEAASRHAFGHPIAANQAVAFPLVEDGTRLASAWLFVQHVASRLEADPSPVGAAAMAKWLATETALAALDHAIQFHGGRGYSRELPHEQRWRDVRSGALAHGTSEIMHRLAARELWPAPGVRDARTIRDPP
jgi:cyclohexanecarboxyl-CoA dehydrogenase